MIVRYGRHFGTARFLHSTAKACAAGRRARTLPLRDWWAKGEDWTLDQMVRAARWAGATGEVWAFSREDPGTSHIAFLDALRYPVLDDYEPLAYGAGSVHMTEGWMRRFADMEAAA